MVSYLCFYSYPCIDDQNDDEIQEIPLPNVKTHILAKVIEFAEHYKVEPMNEIAKVPNLPNFSDFYTAS